jgi:hypothetical protein
VRPLGLALVALSLGSCGGHGTVRDGGDAGGACALDPTDSFVFHVHNAGTSTIVLDLGCGRTLPIILATPAGRLSIGPGGADACEFTCDQIYAGQAVPGGCTDCGPGVSKEIVPGYVVDVAWDRRVYARHTLEPACSKATGTCALGTAVAPTASQLGALTTCPLAQHQPFSCAAPTTTEFTVDTTSAEATIDVP